MSEQTLFFALIAELLAFVDAHPDRIRSPGLSPAEFEDLISLDTRLGHLAKRLARGLPGFPDSRPAHFYYLAHSHLPYHQTNWGTKLSPTRTWRAEIRAIQQSDPSPPTPARPDPLNDYRAEIRAVEDAWLADAGEHGRTLGASPWDKNLDKLRDIDDRHDIAPDDPRVYSIAAYQAERRQIEAEWERTCRRNQWVDLPQDSPDFAVYWAALDQQEARLADCRARHFTGLADAIDTPAKLWAYIHHHALTTLRLLPESDTAQGAADLLGRVRRLLLELKVPWTKAPPYPALNAEDAVNELLWIANRLEADDAERCWPNGQEAPPVPDAAPAQPQRGPVSETLAWLRRVRESLTPAGETTWKVSPPNSENLVNRDVSEAANRLRDLGELQVSQELLAAAAKGPLTEADGMELIGKAEATVFDILGQGADGRDANAGQAPPTPVSESSPGKRLRPSRSEANILMRQYLKEHPTDHTIRGAAAFIGRSIGFTCKLPAWMARPPKTGVEGRQQRSNRRERELTDAILARAGVEADPSEQASLREAAWHYLQRNARNKTDRDRLQKMSDAEREAVIASVIETFDNDIPES